MIGFRVHYILSMTILFLFLIMGVFLGLVGAGGSILSIPILTYGVGMPMVKASAFSFLIVMLLAIIALIQVRATLSLKEYLPFALPTLIAVMVVRAWLLPVINMQMGMHFLQRMLEILLALVMLGAAFSLFKWHHDHLQAKPWPYVYYFMVAFFLGLLLGMVGAGGGFLLIPLLVYSGYFDLSRAISVSYLLIALNSLIAFLSDYHDFSQAEWLALAGYVVIGLLGMQIGLYLRVRVDVVWVSRILALILLLNSVIISLKLGIGFFYDSDKNFF